MKRSKMKEMKKRLLAMLLCILIVLNGSVSALASEMETAHEHTDECYSYSKVSDELICGKEVDEGHIHGDTCYEVMNTQELSCTETEGHIHGDGCFTTVESNICGQDEHAHDSDCYEIKKELVCADESEEHSHENGCYEEAAELICGAAEHFHDGGCYLTETVNNCGQEETEAHVHGDGCYTTVENKTLICQLEEIEAHAHEDGCYEWTKELVCVIPAAEPAAELSEYVVCEVCEKEECECKSEIVESEEVTLTKEVDGVIIEVFAPAGAFDRSADDVYMTAAALTEEQKEEVERILWEEAEKNEEILLDYCAYDINLWADEECTEKIQPKVPVTVNYKNVELAMEDAETVRMTSIDESEQVVEEVEGGIEEDVIEIEMEHFTIAAAAVYGGEKFVPTIASGYLDSYLNEKSNEWQVVSGRYGDTTFEDVESNMVVTEDRLFRYQKNVIPTGTENEFLIYMNVEPQMDSSVKNIVKSIPMEVLDPMGEYIEFLGVVESPTNGRVVFDNETATLKWHEFTEPTVSGNSDNFVAAGTDNEVIYRKNAYELLYKVRLMVEKEGFVSCPEEYRLGIETTEADSPYITNGNTILSYKDLSNADQNAEFVVPQVRGFVKETITHTVNKIWIGDPGADELTVKLNAKITVNGVETELTAEELGLVIEEEDKQTDLTLQTICGPEWTYTWNDLPKYYEYTEVLQDTEVEQSQCVEIEYSVVEILSDELAAKYDVTYATTGNITTITNMPKFLNGPVYELPATGGIGTKIFKIVGCGIMITAAFFIFKGRKKEDE